MNEELKTCNVCDLRKPLSEFYKNSLSKGGYQKRCKNCTKQESKRRLEEIKSDPELYQKEQRRHREKYHRLGYKEKHKPSAESKKAIMDRYRKKYPEKQAAKNASVNMSAPFEGAEKHHWSYNEEHFTDVSWLTNKEHEKCHRFIIYDQERKMYRRFDTNELLDTKERHEQFIQWCIQNKED